MSAGNPQPGKGVGRGHGSGSKSSQFKTGMPSANPSGRPRRAKRLPTSSLKDAVAAELASMISTRENGVTSKRTQAEAMILLLFARFPSATVREQITILRYVGGIAPTALQESNHDFSPDAVRQFVEGLARECGVEE